MVHWARAGVSIRIAVLGWALLVGCGGKDEQRQPVDAAGGAAGAGGGGSAAEGPLEWLGTPVRFADAAEGARILGTSDRFTRNLSAFDRGLRMRTLATTNEQAYLEHAALQALDWNEREHRTWTTAVRRVGEALIGLELDLPDEVWLVQSTGDEDAGFPYTRGNAIVVPGLQLDEVWLAAHELFHLVSREDPALSPSLYPLVGFSHFSGVEFPGELEDRRITNPDAFRLDDVVRIDTAEGPRDVVPILMSRLELPEALEQPVFASVLQLELLEVDVAAERAVRDADGDASVLVVDETDYEARTSVNTGYVYHAEEVLADNFAHLLTRRAGIELEIEDEQPEVLEALEAALSERKSSRQDRR
jgi:hypothetical protein